MARIARTKIGRKRRSRRGGIMVMTAVMMPIIAGFAGLGVDVGIWETNKRSLQTAADSAAISGALEKSLGRNSSAIVSVAAREAGRNGFHSGSGSVITVYNPPRSGSLAGNAAAVEVYLTRPEKPLLASLVFGDSINLVVRSVATMQAIPGGGGRACVLALNPTASASVSITGSTTANMPSCMIAANSTSESAINITGNASLDAYSLHTVGNYAVGGSADVDLGVAASTHSTVIVDPFAGTPIPVAGSCAYNNKKVNKGSTTLSPGTYCGGIDIGSQANVKFLPGTYVINRGDFSVNAQATITCQCSGTSGVTFILTSTSGASQIGNIKINGGAAINLKAPSAEGATYRGLLFYQDGAAPAGGSNKFNGGSAMILQGAIYFPAQEVQWSGNNSTTNCIEVVARTVTFTGNSHLDVTGCPTLGAAAIQISSGSVVKVME